MSNEYLRAFVIGSSWFVFLPYFYIVSNFDKKYFNFDYKIYTYLAPVALGLMNLISLMLSKKFNISHKNRFLYTSIIAPTLVLFTVIYFNIYNYTIRNWIYHIINLYLLYFIVFNYIIYYLDEYV
jgi:hypothetical protein